MLHYDFEESIGYWLTLTTQAYHRRFNDELAPHGVTYRQSQVLGWLALDGEQSQAELAAKMMVEPPTLAGILDRMEKAGWITRNACQTDRRRKLIRTTDKAKPAWEKIVQCARQVRHEATRGLSPEQLRLLREVLAQIRENIAATPAETATAQDCIATTV